MPSQRWIAAAVLLSALPARADVEVAPLIGEAMVFQRRSPIVVWGRAQPGERVDVSIAHRRGNVVAGPDGRWEVRLHPLEAGGPYTLYVAGDNALHFDDVMVGDVWVCAGQSNMEINLAGDESGLEESRGADGSDLRLFRADPAFSDEPLERIGGAWKRAAPVAARSFSAVGWYFGRRLEYELDVPIGLIHCTRGGQSAEPWVDLARLESEESLTPSLERPRREEAPGPGSLYNGMILPLGRFPVTGIAFYQGESNVPVAHHYGSLFRALIESWRAAWGDPELFFLFVQLPNFGAPVEAPSSSAPWARLREAQASALALPNTAMVVTIDIGTEDLHPLDKSPFGRRMAGVVLTDAYGHTDVVSRGPALAEVHVEGERVQVRFARVGEGLSTTDGEAPRGFALAGADHRWSWAEASIEGPDSVVLQSAEVPAPVAVRYAWEDEPRVNLVGAEGLPAEPFRTDDWPYEKDRGR